VERRAGLLRAVPLVDQAGAGDELFSCSRSVADVGGGG